jgi:predicted dehydrogenase
VLNNSLFKRGESGAMKGKIKIVVVGLKFGKYIIESQICTGPGAPFMELVGVFDLDEEKSKTLANTLSVKKYGCLYEILTDPQVQAIGLFTPPAGRAALVRQIINAGKHVITTKPFELNCAEGLKVLKEARSLHKAVHMNSPGPYLDIETKTFLAWQEKFSLGQPVSARWQTFVRNQEQADGSWFDDPLRCPVAPVFRLGIYGINQMISLCGEVQSVGVAHARINTGRPTPDTGELSLCFKNGALGSVFASFSSGDGQSYSNIMEIHFEHGSIRSKVTKPTDNWDEIEKKLILQAKLTTGEVIHRSKLIKNSDIHGKYQWENFENSIENPTLIEDEISPEMIMHAMEVINAMSIAEQNNARVDVVSSTPSCSVEPNADTTGLNSEKVRY